MIDALFFCSKYLRVDREPPGMRPLHVWPLGAEQRKKYNPGKVYAVAEAEAYISLGQGVGREPPGMRSLHVWLLGLE